jgi:hypothetical protein
MDEFKNDKHKYTRKAAVKRRSQPPSKFKRNPAQPVDRTTCDKEMQELIESIREVGQTTPVLITPDWITVDGHRRVTACAALGLKVDYDVRDVDPIAGFLAANIGKVMEGKDRLQAYLNNPLSVEDRYRRAFDKIKDVTGEDGLRTFVSLGGTIGMWNRGVALASYMGYWDKLKVACWVLKHHYSYVVESLLRTKTFPITKLYAAVDRDEPLTADDLVTYSLHRKSSATL